MTPNTIPVTAPAFAPLTSPPPPPWAEWYFVGLGLGWRVGDGCGGRVGDGWGWCVGFPG